MFGKKKKTTTKDDCKCTTKSEANEAIKNFHNTKASDMTSGSRSTKSCGAKSANNTKSYSNLSNANTKSCGSKASSSKACSK